MESLQPEDNFDAKIVRKKGNYDMLGIHGNYIFKCFDKTKKLKWEDTIENVVMTLGKNELLDKALSGSGFTVVGPFMGLISSVDYTGIPVAADTMASHATWFEVDATSHFPTIAARLTTDGRWSPAAGGMKALTSPVSFTIITMGGTIKGGFLVFGAGAVDTLGSTTGILLSAGLFAGGDKVVEVDDIVEASYSLALN